MGIAIQDLRELSKINKERLLKRSKKGKEARDLEVLEEERANFARMDGIVGNVGQLVIYCALNVLRVDFVLMTDGRSIDHATLEGYRFAAVELHKRKVPVSTIAESFRVTTEAVL